MFYELTKNDTTLSATELFKQRQKGTADNSLPGKGGEKEFEPDGSWIEVKAIESFLQERTRVLAEPRVEKLKSLIIGEWNPEDNLVNVEKTGKFWSHMGFTDNRRNYLYPEEALFLMESNTLEVYHKGCPLSIQQGYSYFLGSTDKNECKVSVHEYQVFSHLRRLGFVVLRHEKNSVITNYERKINIKISKQEIKARKKQAKENDKKLNIETKESSNRLLDKSPSKALENSDSQKENEKLDEGLSDISSNIYESTVGDIVEEIEDTSSDPALCGAQSSNSTEEDMDQGEDLAQNNLELSRSYYTNEWRSCFQSKFKSNETNLSRSTLSDENVQLPDIFGKQELKLSWPDQQYLPHSLQNATEQDTTLFDVGAYRTKSKQSRSRKRQKEEDRDDRMRKLRFSYADWTDRSSVLKASNWAEYKANLIKRKEAAASTPVDHLWNGPIKPLLRPEDATSYASVLEKLSIIPAVENEDFSPRKSDLKISFDVHLPDSSFKKSMPGVPNHRVCVTQNISSFPCLADVHELWSRCKDTVPLHWAVVHAGEIAFYAFDNGHVTSTLTSS